MIEVRNIVFRYSDGTLALDDVSIDLTGFAEDHILAIIGESGSGKTTLLNCLGRFIEPQSGIILYDGKDIRSFPEKEFRQLIGIVFQKLYLFPHLTVLENMVLPMRKVLGKKEKEAEDISMDFLLRLGIDGIAESYPSKISGGQAQRAAIARGLVMEPGYMLLDEPTSALDAKTTTSFGNWLSELNAETNFIIVTHDIPFARAFATHGVHMADGHVVGQGEIKDLAANFNIEASDGQD